MADVIKIKPEQLQGEIDQILQTFNHKVTTAADLAAVEAAKNAVKELKTTSPERSGAYARGWSYKKQKNGTTVVYNRTLPGLTHLLEYGHPIVKSGRVVGHARAKSHILAAEEHSATAFENFLKENIEKGK